MNPKTKGSIATPKRGIVNWTQSVTAPEIETEAIRDGKKVAMIVELALEILGGTIVRLDLLCPHCDGCRGYRRTVKRIWPNRRADWGCHFCGRSLEKITLGPNSD